MKKVYFIPLLLALTFFCTLNVSVLANSAKAPGYQYQYLGKWDNQGVPKYLDPLGDLIDQNLFTRLMQSLPENQSVLKKHPEYIVSSGQADVTLIQEADVWVTFVYEGAGYRNALGYYTFTKGNAPQTIEDIKDKLTIIFPNASLPGSGGNLKKGSRVKIGHFPANTCIGWFLVADGFSGNSVKDGNWLFFSDQKLNPETDTSLRRHNVLLKDSLSKKTILGFEDVKMDQGSDRDFNDVLFYITSDPVTAVDQDKLPEVEDSIRVDPVDLSLTKTVDIARPKNGDILNFSIRVNNIDKYAANEVCVKDLLAPGLKYLESSASQGSYDQASGQWNLGELDPSGTAKLNIRAQVDMLGGNLNLGPAKDYDLFVLNTLNQPSSDTQGRVAVGHDCYLANYSIGDRLKSIDSLSYSLVVGGNLTYLSGAIYGGGVACAGLTNLPQDPVSLEGYISKTIPFDFTKAEIYLKNLSQTLKNYSVNSHVSNLSGKLILEGNNPYLNVFMLDGTLLSQANDFQIDVPKGSAAIVNISGKQLSLSGGQYVTGTGFSQVIYNCYEAEYISLANIALEGSLLAPLADLDFPSGVIEGQAVVKNMTGSGQFNHAPFAGNIPVDFNITNYAQIVFSNAADPNAANNSSSVSVKVQPDSAQGSSVRQPRQYKWEKLPDTQPELSFVWTITPDAAGNLLAGTWGGAIYRSPDFGKSWTKINDSLGSAFIWSIATKDNWIFASSEHGVFSSKDNGKTFSSVLSSKDIRSMLIDGNSIFAASWGDGIYKSSDEGRNWTKIEGLTSEAITSLTKTGNGTYYATTMGNGLFRSSDSAKTWAKLKIPARNLWSFASDGNGTLYAGTYGDGAYYSSDNGATWTQMNADSTGDYIYSMTACDKQGLIMSSWNNGIILAEPQGSSISAIPLGLKGSGAGFAYYNPSNKTVLASTNQYGLLSMSISSINSVSGDEKDALPKEFSLSQNYPNPFNPATSIDFTLACQGRYSLKVYNLLGQLVLTIADRKFEQGHHSVNFDASAMPSGVYIYRLSGQGMSLSKKMVLLK